VRVLWLIKGLGPGGAEKLLVHAAAARDGERYRYEAAYLLPWKRTLVPDLERAGIPVECLDGGREWDLRWAGRLRARLVRRPVDVVHVHSPYVAGVARLVVRSVPRRIRPAVMTTEHLPWHGYAPATRALNAATFGLDDVHVAVSGEVVDSIPPRRRGRMVQIVHGIAPASLAAHRDERDEVRRELGVGPDTVVVGTVANYRAQKAYPDLLRAARIVLDAGVDVRFAAVGQGPEEGSIRELHGSLGLGDGFVLLGEMAEPARLLAACDLFVLASRYEGLPVAVMEALAMGLPVVASDVGGVPQLVEDGVHGLLVPPARPDLLAAALLELATDPGRRARMGRAAEAAGRELDVASAVRRIEALYDEASGRPAASAPREPERITSSSPRGHV
jgi:glycosyltransferase involved in cell wall biosynthesis